MKSKAIFLDRDGVINDLIYHSDSGIITSPLNTDQFVMIFGAIDAIKIINNSDYLAIIVSNQPGIAKEQLTFDMHRNIQQKMNGIFRCHNIYVDQEYYCFHHPNGSNKRYAIECDCRKPLPGLVLNAAKDFDIDLEKSWMIGDSITDIQMAQGVSMNSILVGRKHCVECNILRDLGISDVIVKRDLHDAVSYILNN